MTSLGPFLHEFDPDVWLLTNWENRIKQKEETNVVSQQKKIQRLFELQNHLLQTLGEKSSSA